MTASVDWLRWRRRLLPAGTVMAGSLAMALPLPLAWGVMPNAALGLMLLWASVQPALLPVWAGFVLGLFHDAVLGQPLGLSALLFPFLIVLVRLADDRLEAHSIAIDWALMAVLIAIHAAATAGLLLLLGLAVPLWPLVAQAGLTTLAWPVLVALAARLHRRFADEGA